MDLLINVHVDDLAKTIAFYEQAIGLRAEHRTHDRMKIGTLMKTSNLILAPG